MQKLRSIQVLRGLAALAVVLCHARIFSRGSIGVDLFFVISGSIMATIAPSRSPGQFFRDRLWRIYPNYWVQSVPWLILAFAIGAATTGRTLSSLTLWPLYADYSPPYLRVAWTLCFEMLFYCGVTLALATRPVVPLAIFAACFLMRGSSPVFAFMGCPLILEFLFGALVARTPQRQWLAVPLVGLAAIAIGVTPTYEQIGIDQPLLRAFEWGLPSAALVYAAISSERLFTKWAAIPVLLGDASYSIYLVHIGIVTALPWSVGVPLSVALGLLSYRYIERPIVSWRRTLRPRMSSSAESPRLSPSAN